MLTTGKYWKREIRIVYASGVGGRKFVTGGSELYHAVNDSMMAWGV